MAAFAGHLPLEPVLLCNLKLRARLGQTLRCLQAAFGDNYRLLEEMGGGGMSRVFLALEVELHRRVVIKVRPPDMAAGVDRERARLSGKPRDGG